MKSTRKILSALLTLCMLLGCVSVGFIAQAAAFATEITSDYTWTGGDVKLEDTLKITNTSGEKIFVDLGNATITGPVGKPVVEIKGNVEVYNATFMAVSADFQGETAFLKALKDYKPAVVINGGDVTLNCITAVGSLIRIPNSASVKVTTGNGINANEGNVTLKHVIACGMKALDNTNATVTVEDSILVGIYKAINIYNKVNFAEGYEQYDTIDFLNGLLDDSKSMTPREEEILRSLTNSQGEVSVASIVANVKAPAINDLTSSYSYADGKLTVTAQADTFGVEAAAPNRYSYQYTPNTCTIDGTTVDFVEKDGKYVAEFEGMQAGKTYDVDADYDLSVKLGKRQKDVLVNAIDSATAYVERAPELLYRFVEDFENLYAMAWRYATLFYNAKDTDEFASMFNDAAMKKLYAIILSLVGENFDGFNDLSSVSRTAYWTGNRFFDKHVNNGELDKAYAFVAYYDTNSFGSFFDEETPLHCEERNVDITRSLYFKRNADFSGVGILEEFDKYYQTIKGLMYTDGVTNEWNDPVAAAQYIGDNWEAIYELVDAALVLVDAANGIIHDPNLSDNLTAILGSGSFKSVIDMFDIAYKYANKLKDKADSLLDSDFVKQYGPNAGDYCAEYTEKALYILNNLDAYFNINIEGDYINLSKAPFDFTKSQEIATAQVITDKGVRVDYTVSGMGNVTINGEAVSTTGYKTFKVADDVVIMAESLDGYNFSHMIIRSTDGSQKIVTSDTYKTKAATNLDVVVVFESMVAAELGAKSITFMSDGALNYKLLATLEYELDDIDYLADDVANIQAPVFKDLTFKGWGLNDKESVTASALTELVDDITDSTDSNFFVYAIYEYQENVTVPVQGEAIKMMDVTTDAERNYFKVSLQVPDGYNAVEAGIIATKNTDYATEANMTIDLSGQPGVVFGRISKTGADGFVERNHIYTLGVRATGTVYARGYVVLIDANNVSTVVYTDIYASEVTA